MSILSKEEKDKFGIPTLTPERFTYIDTMMSIAEDFSDGAFFGFMQEKGISTEEVCAWQEQKEEKP